MSDALPMVLVVDDDVVMRSLLASALAHAGYRVETAEDGVAGLACIERCRPRLVLLDGVMPRKDGWAVLAEIRHLADPPHVIMISATADPARATRLGAAGCLRKPFHIADLIARCEELLAVSHASAT